MLSDVSTVSIIISIVVGALFGYGAYWALTIARALMNYVYKRQALWAGRVAVYFIAQSAFIALVVFYNAIGFYVNLLAAAFIAVGFAVIFLWIDSTVLVARRSDPLQRNTLRWSKLRYFIGITTAIGIFFNVIFNVIFTNPNTQSYDLLGSPPLVGFIGTLLLLGGIALLLSAKRSGDLTLKRHLKWFGLGAALLFLSGQIGSPWAEISPNSVWIPIVTYSLFAIAAYCFYRSAKSLAPLGRVSLEDLAPAIPSIATS
jgi:MFS family permease